MKIFSFMFVLGLCSTLVHAYVPPPSFLVQKLAQTTGSGIYLVDQDVVFQNGADTLILKEQIMAENESSMKILVTGTRDLKDTVSAFFVYGDSAGAQKGANEHFERLLFARSTQFWNLFLLQTKILPSSSLTKKAPRNLKEAEYIPDPYTRITRLSGALALQLGQASTNEKKWPSLWVDQENFFLRQVRFDADAEVLFDQHSQYARQLTYPKTKVVRWGNNTVSISVNSVSSRNKTQFQQFGAQTKTRWDGIQAQPGRDVITEFYQRFR